MFKNLPRLQDDTAIDPGAGAAPEVAAPAAPPAAPDVSLLGQGAAPAPLHEVVPEKFRVFKGEGEQKEFDADATLRKVTDSYTALEKLRPVAAEIPKAPEEYAPEITVEGFDFAAFKEDPGTKEFLKGAHAKGMTNEQVSYVLNRYYESAPELVQAAKLLDRQTCAAELKKVWADDAAFESNLKSAFQGFQSLAGKAGVTLEDIEASGVANSPVVLRLLAAIGQETREDPGVHNGSASAHTETISELLVSEAYTNPRHPQHEAVSKRVKSYYESKFPTT